MQSLRRRVPFSFADDASDGDKRVLDEQEQDELIHKFRMQAHTQDARYTIAARLLVSLSIILHLIHALTQSSPTLLVFLSLVVHLNLFLYILPPRIRKDGKNLHLPSPLSFGLTYALSAVAPTLCLFIGHSWQIISWWCITPAMVFTVQTMKTSVYETNENIAALENLRYRAPGA